MISLKHIYAVTTKHQYRIKSVYRSNITDCNFLKMFANRQYSVDSHESIDSLVKSKIVSCLTRDMLNEMLLEPDRFGEESYFKFLLAMYCNLCELTTIAYYPIEWHDHEPIMHYTRKDRTVVHLFSKPVIIDLFKGIIGSNTCKSTELANTNVRIKQIHVIPNNGIALADGMPTLPSHIADKLILLTVIADHGAWHYYNLKRSRNAKEYRLTAHQLNRHISLASLITSSPDSQVQKQTTECMHPCLIIKTSNVDSDAPVVNCNTGNSEDDGDYEDDDDEDECNEPFSTTRRGGGYIKDKGSYKDANDSSAVLNSIVTKDYYDN
ncbi:Orf118 [Heliothis zea nudivirus]|uniref:Orf118 n=1 Tax=Heliothis zea nudivirus 1 TaxID=3116536 RepID=Q8JKJ5_9VIRU|nr:Orf118 [Heliothis zea nudivirus]AAN04411.1 Orf118 [Heliothis zea nudivirus]